MSAYEGDEDFYQALAAGAQAYLIKCMPSDVLVDAVRKVHARLRAIPSSVAKNLAARTPNSRLTHRERDVLELIVKGRSNKEIAAELGTTEGTVKCHVNVILSRLGVSDRTQAAIAAWQPGIVHLQNVQLFGFGEVSHIQPFAKARHPAGNRPAIALAQTESVSHAGIDMQFRGGAGLLERKV